MERRSEGRAGCWPATTTAGPASCDWTPAVSGIDSSYIQAVYYPGENQIQTVMQQGDLFSKQEQLFSVVAMGPTTLLTVDLDVETTMPVPTPMVKKMVNDALEHLADNLKKRAEALPPISYVQSPSSSSRAVSRRAPSVNCEVRQPDHRVDVAAPQCCDQLAAVDHGLWPHCGSPA